MTLSEMRGGLTASHTTRRALWFHAKPKLSASGRPSTVVTSTTRFVASFGCVARRWRSAEVAAVLGEPLLVDDPMLTASQVGALLGVNLSTVNRMTRRGLLVRGQGSGPLIFG